MDQKNNKFFKNSIRILKAIIIISVIIGGSVWMWSWQKKTTREMNDLEIKLAESQKNNNELKQQVKNFENKILEFQEKFNFPAISAKEASKKLSDFLSQVYEKQMGKATVMEIKEESGLYKIDLLIEND